MSENIELEITLEGEDELKPVGHGDGPLFRANWFRVEERIGRTFLLRIRVTSRADSLDLADLIGRRVRLVESRTLPQEGGLRQRPFQAVVTSAQQRNYNRGLGLYTYWLDCRPALEALTMTTQCRIMCTDHPRTLPEIIDYILTDSFPGEPPKRLDPIKGDIVYRTSFADAKSDYQQRDLLIQYNETDLDFLQRQIERYGIFYFFDPYGDKEMVIISDHNESFKFTGNVDSLADAVTLNFVEPPHYAPGNSYKVKNFIPRYYWKQKSIKLYDYNYHRPADVLSGEHSLDDKGEGRIRIFGGHLMPFHHNESRLLASRSGELVMSTQSVATGISDCFELAAGFVFSLAGHYNDRYNTHPHARDSHGYLVTEVIHECEIPEPGLPWDPEIHGHQARFTAIDSSIVYRPPKVTPAPQVPGPVSATVDSSGDGLRADLDDQGRYLVQAKFHLGDLPDGKNSSRLRLAEAYSGRPEGISFPLRKGAEVAIGFENGDMNRPIMLAAAPNPATTSPTNAHLHTRSRLITASSITLEFEDGTGEESITDSGAPGAASSVHPVTAPPLADTPSSMEFSPSGTSEAPGTSNWARLFLSFNGQQTYLRLGAVPHDECASHLRPIQEEELPSKSGWIDYTQGDRTSGTQGDKVEVVGGDELTVVVGRQKLLVDLGTDEQAEAVLPRSADAGRTVIVANGSTERILTGDQSIDVLSGVQTLCSGEPADMDAMIEGKPTTNDQVLFASHDQYVYSGNDQFLESGGNQTYEIGGNQNGTVHGTSQIRYLGAKHTETYSGAKSDIYKGARTEVVLGVSTEFVLGGSISLLPAFEFATIAASVEIYGFHTDLNGAYVEQSKVHFEDVGTAVSSFKAKLESIVTCIKEHAVGVNQGNVQVNDVEMVDFL